MAKSFSAEVMEIVDGYKSQVKGVAQEACEKAAKDTAKRLRAVQHPRLTGDYAKGWAVMKKGPDTFIVHNKTEYRLTHLLENGHVSANQYGSGYTRVNGIKHIEPAAEEGANEFINEVERQL